LFDALNNFVLKFYHYKKYVYVFELIFYLIDDKNIYFQVRKIIFIFITGFFIFYFYVMLAYTHKEIL